MKEVKDMTIADVLETPAFYNNLKVVISDLGNTRRNAGISANAPLKRHPIGHLQERGVFEPGQMAVLYATAMDKKLQGYSSSERQFILQVGGEAFNKTMKQLIKQENNDKMETKIVKTHTGKIYVDTKNKLEFLTVGDYGKENNIKANFFRAYKRNKRRCKYRGRFIKKMGCNNFNSKRLSDALQVLRCTKIRILWECFC